MLSPVLYHDIQATIKHCFITAAKLKTFKPGSKYYPFLIGDDRLEETHGILRTLTHNSTPDMLEIEHLHRHAIEIALILARHPSWRRRQKRREESKDHSNSDTWDRGGGNLTIGSTFGVGSCWTGALSKVEQLSLVVKLFAGKLGTTDPSGSPIVRFSALRGPGEKFTMLKPRGERIGVKVDESAPEIFVFTDTSHLDILPMGDEGSVLETMDDMTLDALADFQDGLVEDSEAQKQQTPNRASAATTKIATTITVGGKEVKKGAYLRHSFQTGHLIQSREMRCRGYMLGHKHGQSGADTVSAIDVSAEMLNVDDPVLVLVNVPGHIAPAIARVTQIAPRDKPRELIDGIAWSEISRDIVLTVHINAVRPAATEEDSTVVTVPQAWIDGVKLLAGDLVAPLDPDQVTVGERLAWSVSADALRTIGNASWSKHSERSAEFPKISIRGDDMPYKDAEGKPIFCTLAEADNATSAIGDPSKRKCPKCQKQIDTKEFSKHIAAHILSGAMDPHVCGYCGEFGKGCTVGVSSNGYGQSKTYSAAGECKVDPHAWKGFKMAMRANGATATCSQRPMECPFCPGSVFKWKFAMYVHVYTDHEGPSGVRKLIQDPLWQIFDKEWIEAGAMGKKRSYLLPSVGYPMLPGEAPAAAGTLATTAAVLPLLATTATATDLGRGLSTGDDGSSTGGATQPHIGAVDQLFDENDAALRQMYAQITAAAREAALANAAAAAAVAPAGVGNEAAEVGGGTSGSVSDGACSAVTGTASPTVGDGDGAAIEAQQGTAGTAPTAGSSASTMKTRSRG